MKRDLIHALRSLAKERAFTLVCVISLGIGMGAFVALVTFNRMLAAPAHGINPEGVTELLVLPHGPLRAKAGVWALEEWSYPDYQVLRDAEIGMDITGWTTESPLTLGPDPLGIMEPLIDAIASTIAITVALLAGLPAGRRATAVQPMAAIRSE